MYFDNEILECAGSAFDSKARSHWLNRDHVNEIKSNVTQLVNFSKMVDLPVNTAVALSRLRAEKFGGKIGCGAC